MADPQRHPPELTNLIAGTYSAHIQVTPRRADGEGVYYSERYGFADKMLDALRDAGYIIIKPTFPEEAADG